LELGVGFAFVGSQCPLTVGGEDFRIDLLFYHLKLRCYVVIELKAVPFQPEFAGKMNFYLSAVNNLLRHPDDQPSIGLILCKTKNQVVAEYALEDYSKPMGISEYRLAESLPEKLQGSLPTLRSWRVNWDRRLRSHPERASLRAVPGSGGRHAEQNGTVQTQ